MNWDEFVIKLKEAKKLGLNTGLDVGCITNLIYAGAFDDMIGGPPGKGESLDKYNSMFESVRSALKSKAAKPKKTKTQPIGIDDIKNDTQLGLWRFLVNPMSGFDFMPYCKDILRNRGFSELSKMQMDFGLGDAFLLHHQGNTESFPNPSYVVNKWGNAFTDRFGKHVQQMILNGERYICMVGVITASKKLPYSNGSKKRAVLEFYNGSEVVKDLTIWPGRATNRLPDYTLTMGKMSFGIITIHPKVWNGRKTGTVIGWERFVV